MKNNKVIITGASSFVGMHLAKNFTKDGWDVCAVTSRPTSQYDGIRGDRLAAIPIKVNLVKCDLTDGMALGKLIEDEKPDLWIHHAAYADNYASNDYDLKKSLTLNLLALEPLYKNLSRMNCGVIVTGSSMEYSSSDIANVEDDTCWPDFPYGVSKLAETIECQRLAKRYDVPTRVARLYIPVGTYDAPEKLIGSVVDALLQGKSVDLSPCLQKRDFLGVDDIAIAYLKLASDFNRQKFDVMNICSGEARQLRAVLEELCSIINADPSLLKFGARAMRSGEPVSSFGSNEKAKKLLNWQPLPLEKTLTMLVDERQNNRGK